MTTEQLCSGRHREPEIITDSKGKCSDCEFVGRIYWKGTAGDAWIIRHKPVSSAADDKTT